MAVIPSLFCLMSYVLVAFKKSCLQLYMAGEHKIAETERFYFYNYTTT